MTSFSTQVNCVPCFLKNRRFWNLFLQNCKKKYVMKIFECIALEKFVVANVTYLFMVVSKLHSFFKCKVYLRFLKVFVLIWYYKNDICEVWLDQILLFLQRSMGLIKCFQTYFSHTKYLVHGQWVNIEKRTQLAWPVSRGWLLFSICPFCVMI